MDDFGWRVFCRMISNKRLDFGGYSDYSADQGILTIADRGNGWKESRFLFEVFRF